MFPMKINWIKVLGFAVLIISLKYGLSHGAERTSQSYYVNWGMAFDYPGGGQYSDVQTYSLGTKQKLNNTFDLFAEFGGWKDPGHYQGARPGAFIVSGLILDLKLQERYVSYSLAPAFIGPTDTLLGGNFQLYHKVSLGFRDKMDKRIGIFIKHFSDAGLAAVNYGRNFLGMEIQF